MTERTEHVAQISERLDTIRAQITNTTISNLETWRAKIDRLIGAVKDADDHAKKADSHLVHVAAVALESGNEIDKKVDELYAQSLAIINGNGKHAEPPPPPTPRMLDDQDLAVVKAKISRARE